jgi:hypothetical protein
MYDSTYCFTVLSRYCDTSAISINIIISGLSFKPLKFQSNALRLGYLLDIVVTRVLYHIAEPLIFSSSQDAVKKLEQHVEDHEQYKNAHAQCSSWLSNAQHQLLLTADTAGDRETILKHIDSLHVSHTFRFFDRHLLLGIQ